VALPAGLHAHSALAASPALASRDGPVKISVVVPTLNRVEDLRRCLAGLACQSRPADQIVVVVHESDVATQEALAAWRDRVPEVTVRTAHARGLPAALNAGLDAAAGDLICFTDDDAEPWPDWLARIEAQYRDSSVGAVHPPDAVEVDTLKGVNMSYRATALRGFRFDERLCVVSGSCTEIDAGFFLKRGGWRLIYDPAIRVNHHMSGRAWGVERSHPDVSYDFSHNYTYVILKHASWPRKVCSLVYFLLVGQRRAWGLLAILIDPFLTGELRWWGQLGATLRGRIAGVRSYLASRRASRANR